MPTARQFAILCSLWGLMAWLTTAVWGMDQQNLAFGDALRQYYAIRAPLVGAFAGAVWAPVLCAGMLPGRASALAGRVPGLSVESPTRRLFRVVQGAVVGQLVGVTVTLLLLLIWPNDMQNTRMDAFKWAKVFWGLSWEIFVPAGALAGVLSVWVAVRFGRPRPAAPEA
jgi:hypothetical protein